MRAISRCGVVWRQCLVLIMAVVGLSQVVRSEGPVVVAHRGLLRDAPENTLAGFRAALDLRVGFEVDVRRCLSGELVCVHDNTVNRTTNGTGRVSDLSWAELSTLDAGGWFDPAYEGTPIPKLSEVFGLLREKPEADVLIAIDLKGEDEEIEHDVVALAEEFGVLERLLFIGRAIQHPEVRVRLHEANRKAQVAAVANDRRELANVLEDASADWAYLRFIPTPEEIEMIRATGRDVFLAGPTVATRQEKNWILALRAGVDAILTDDALELRRLVRLATR